MADDLSGATEAWLLETDPAIRWQVMRDLLGRPESEWGAVRASVAEEGWGAELLRHQRADGSWSEQVYTPKWTSTFYTMQLLRLLGLPPSDERGQAGARIVLERGARADGGLVYGSRVTARAGGETCISGMGLATVAYFGVDDPRVDALVEHLLREQMDDGGWNCQRRRGATHASFNTTILVLEGLLQWERMAGSDARVTAARHRGEEFLLAHRMFRSHRTGDVVNPAYLRFPFPGRWHYDVLRGLEYLAEAGAERDERAREAVELLIARRSAEGRWPGYRGYTGPVYFSMEGQAKASRWNTLRAMRVLRWWESQAA